MAEEPEVVPEGTELPPGTNKLYQNTYRQKPEQYGEVSSASHSENPLRRSRAFRTSPPRLGTDATDDDLTPRLPRADDVKTGLQVHEGLSLIHI